MRRLVAVECGATLAREVAALMQRLCTRAAQRAPVALPTWPSADRLHLTIRFMLSGGRDQPIGTAHVDAITLFESRLSPQGAATWQGSAHRWRPGRTDLAVPAGER